MIKPIVLGVLIFSSGLAAADFNGQWQGSGQLKFGASSGPCESIKLEIHQSESALWLGPGHAECGEYTLNWKGYQLFIKDGLVLKSNGESIGKIDEHEIKTQEKNAESGSISTRTLRLDKESLSFNDSIVDGNGEEFFLLEALFAR